MKYLVINKKTGKDISSDVKVIQENENDYLYCRMMADEMLDKADKFHEKYVMDAIGSTDLVEYDSRKKEWNKMMEIAGDWEDKEFAARFRPVVNLLSRDSENPLRMKIHKLEMMKIYVNHMRIPSLGKYLT